MFDSVCKLFDETIRNMFGCGCYFVEYYGVVVILLNIMVLFVVVGGVLLDRPCMVFQRVRLDAPSICFCMSHVISSFKSLRAGLQLSLCCFFV